MGYLALLEEISLALEGERVGVRIQRQSRISMDHMIDRKFL